MHKTCITDTNRCLGVLKFILDFELFRYKVSFVFWSFCSYHTVDKCRQKKCSEDGNISTSLFLPRQHLTQLHLLLWWNSAERLQGLSFYFNRSIESCIFWYLPQYISPQKETSIQNKLNTACVVFFISHIHEAFPHSCIILTYRHSCSLSVSSVHSHPLVL